MSNDDLAKAIKAIDSFVSHGNWIPGSPEVVGATFDFRGVPVRFDGHANRKVWSDAEDGWVTRYVPTYSYAEAMPAATPKVVARRYAIRADNGKGYFAIVGKSQSSAATTKADKATIFGTKEEAEAAMAAVAEAAPGYFGANQNILVVVVKQSIPKHGDAPMNATTISEDMANETIVNEAISRHDEMLDAPDSIYLPEATTETTTEAAITITPAEFDIARHNVVVTVISKATGDHRTFKVKTIVRDIDWGTEARPFVVKAGTRVAYLLTGPDREDSTCWRRFGFIGHTGIIRVFGPLRGTEFDRFALMLANPTRFTRTAEFKLMAYCSRCNRPLTHPESLASGMGPICREKTGF